jgi:hypothetical protein
MGRTFMKAVVVKIQELSQDLLGGTSEHVPYYSRCPE